MKLSAYKKKREFKKTPEPKAISKTRRSRKKLFVVQKHHASHLHYDFRLELNGVLLSWAVPKGPCLDPRIKRLAVHVEDHPLAYGSFEGTIPKGQYGAGTVILWDRGEWISLDDDADKAYRKGNMSFNLKGKKLQGKWKLVRIKKDDKNWLLIKINDDYAHQSKQYDVESAEPSVVSDPPDPFPESVSPELATLVAEPPSGKNWLHEIKFDGYRIIAVKKEGKTKLLSRNHHDWTKKFPQIAAAINQFPANSLILDGEIVVLDEHQRSNFECLQQAIKNKDDNFIYYVFDLLYLDTQRTTSLPLLERKKLLGTLFSKKQPDIKLSEHLIGSGKQIYKKSCELGLEGIISKDARSVYTQRRTQDWLKSKCSKHEEFVIVGFTQPKNKRSHFGSLLLGTHNNKKELIYCGHVGTGFSEKNLRAIKNELSKNIVARAPLKQIPKNTRGVTWVKPVLMAEVEFVEWTNAGLLRQPSFKGMKQDKAAMKYTHLDKLLYPQDHISKNDLIEYFQSVRDWMLPFITERPLTLVRCTQNFQHCFYQRHPDSQSKKSPFKTIKSYLYIDDEESLLMLPQYNVLEIHPWGSRIDALDYPDVMIFDLDPAEDLPWKMVAKAAQIIRKELVQIKLKSFVKVTGGKGLHVVIPIKPEYEWDTVKLFSKSFVEYLTLNYPDLFVKNMQKNRRRGRIFVDYLRNQKSATAIAPYSPRARIHAPVAVPIHWDELTNDKRDTFFTVKTIVKRLERMRVEVWKDYFDMAQKLKIKHPHVRDIPHINL